MLQAQVPPTHYRITTIAGVNRLSVGTRATEVILRRPGGLAYGPDGSLYVAEQEGHVIRKLSPDGTVSVVAGIGREGYSGDNGPAVSARISSPRGIAVDTVGNVYFTDTANNRVRKVDTNGLIRTIAGTGTRGFLGDGGPAIAARMASPLGIVIDTAGNVIFSDLGNRRVRRIAPDGTISTLAGTGSVGNVGDGGPATAASLSSPYGLALDSTGSLYIADYDAERIRKVSAAGTISTIAGNGTALSLADGTPPAAIQGPLDVAVVGAVVYFIEYDANKIRSIDGNGNLRTHAGPATGFAGDGGFGTSAAMRYPQGIAASTNGVVFSDFENDRVRRVDNAGMISTLMGSSGTRGEAGVAAETVLNRPSYLAITGNGTLVVADRGNRRIRTISSGNIANLGGTGYSGSITFNRALASAQTDSIEGLAIQSNGMNLRYTSSGYNLILGQTGALSGDAAVRPITTSNTSGFAGDGLAAIDATVRLSSPAGMAYDAQGNFYFADAFNYRIRRIHGTTGVIDTVAGNGEVTSSGDGGPAKSAGLLLPVDVAVAPNGDLLIAEVLRIRKVDAAGNISTIAGGGTSTGDFIRATDALILPTSVAADAAGNIYFTDSNVVRVVTPDGMLRTIAGNPVASGFSGDGGLARSAQLDFAYKVVIDTQGRVIFSDSRNDRIRMLTPLPATSLSIVSGNNQTAAGNTRVANPLVVKITAADGTPLPDMPVTFKIESGVATLVSADARTRADGTAQVQLSLGNAAGAVGVSVASPGLTTVTFTAAVTTPVSLLRPAIRSTGGVITAGAFGASPVIAPGSWIEVYGTNLAAVSRQWAGSDFSGNQAPRSLSGVKVTIGGQDAYVSLISPTQINAQVPDGILASGASTATAQVTVTTAEGTSEPVTVQVAAFSPGLLAPWAAYTSRPYIFGSHADGVYVGPANLVTGVSFRPAKPGDTITLYAVGFGATNPVSPAGNIVPAIAPLASPARIRIGGVEARVTFAGLIPGALGLYQINLVVPQVAGGEQTVAILNAAGTAMPGSYVIPIQLPE
jgi:trimeric autotransporter adhesin